MVSTPGNTLIWPGGWKLVLRGVFVASPGMVRCVEVHAMTLQRMQAWMLAQFFFGLCPTAFQHAARSLLCHNSQIGMLLQPCGAMHLLLLHWLCKRT
jgi:hypothetical protein